MLRHAMILLGSLCIGSTAYAGAWLQPAGDGLYISQLTYYATDKYFDSNGQLQAQPRFSKYEFQPYVEYGLRDYLTIGGSAYVEHVVQSGRSNDGIADPELFARLRLWHNDKQVVSIQPLVKLRSIFANDKPPRGGSESTDAELSLLYGRNVSIFTSRDYIDTRIGYRTRNNGLGDQLRADTSIGIKLTDDFEIISSGRVITAVNPKDMATYSENGELDYSVVKTEITGIYHLNDAQWIQAGAFKHIAGVQTGDGYGLSVGFAQRF